MSLKIWPDNNSLSRCRFLFWKINVFWRVWISSLETPSVMPLQMCVWLRGTLRPQKALLGQPQGILSRDGPVSRTWASISVPTHHVRTSGLLWKLGRYSSYCACPGYYLAQISAVSFLHVQEEQPSLSFCNTSSSARRAKCSFSWSPLLAEQSVLGHLRKGGKGGSPAGFSRKGGTF